MMMMWFWFGIREEEEEDAATMTENSNDGWEGGLGGEREVTGWVWSKEVRVIFRESEIIIMNKIII